MKTNPFTNEQMKNYVLLYTGVVIIIVLFFIASNLFYEVKTVEKKHFDVNQTKISKQQKDEEQKVIDKKNSIPFKMMKTGLN